MQKHDMNDVSRRSLLRGAAGGILAAGMGSQLLSQAIAQQESTGRKTGWALVGLGRLTMGELLPAFKETRHCRVTALVSGSPDKAKKLAGENGISEKSIYSYEDFDRIADNPEVDVVYIVLPNSMHAEYTIRAAKAGKHVFCEKPMANSSEECRQMIDACNAAKKKLAVAYRLRYEPFTQAAIRMVREQAVGPAKVITADAGFALNDPGAWRLNKDLAGGGALMDIGIYALNATRYLTGEEPVEINAQIHTPRDDPRFKTVEESCTWQTKFPSGILANCSTSYSYPWQNRFRVAGTRGWIDMDPFVAYRGLRLFVKKGGEPEEIKLTPVNHFVAEMDHFAECVLNDTQPLTPGEEGLKDLLAIEAIYRSAAEGKTIRL
jgi:predicted dehydrogenase